MNTSTKKAATHQFVTMGWRITWFRMTPERVQRKIFTVCLLVAPSHVLGTHYANITGPAHGCCQVAGLSELAGALHSMPRHRPTQNWLEQSN